MISIFVLQNAFGTINNEIKKRMSPHAHHVGCEQLERHLRRHQQ
jgi:hypothetical protein